MKRLPDWEKLLHEEIESARRKQFQWGVFDCALFACDCVRAMTGVDPAVEFRGKYADEAGAEQMMLGKRLGKFAHSIAMANGMPPVFSTYARRGDLVIANNGTRDGALGIVSHHGHFAWCAAEKGLLQVPMARWWLGWKVG